jgi:hypothetical protein
MIVITGPSMCDGGHIDISKYISWNFLHFTFFLVKGQGLQVATK